MVKLLGQLDNSGSTLWISGLGRRRRRAAGPRGVRGRAGPRRRCALCTGATILKDRYSVRIYGSATRRVFLAANNTRATAGVRRWRTSPGAARRAPRRWRQARAAARRWRGSCPRPRTRCAAVAPRHPRVTSAPPIATACRPDLDIISPMNYIENAYERWHRAQKLTSVARAGVRRRARCCTCSATARTRSAAPRGPVPSAPGRRATLQRPCSHTLSCFGYTSSIFIKVKFTGLAQILGQL
jgi:hypothetical protein